MATLHPLQPPDICQACDATGRVLEIHKRLSEKPPRIHCLTNAVTMHDMANILLAIGGSAIMAQDAAEAAQITELCQATLLNTGTPSDEKFLACQTAGATANALAHPVVLDPVGVGASTYRQEKMKELLLAVHPDFIRCNLEEALTLLALAKESAAQSMLCKVRRGGVESGIHADISTRADVARLLAGTYRACVLISGNPDAISDGRKTVLVTGGDARVTRITGSGCMLSAICAAVLATGENGLEAALGSSIFWKLAAECAGRKTDACSGGMGSFHRFLFDAATNFSVGISELPCNHASQTACERGF